MILPGKGREELDRSLASGPPGCRGKLTYRGRLNDMPPKEAIMLSCACGCPPVEVKTVRSATYSWEEHVRKVATQLAHYPFARADTILLRQELT